MNRHQRAHLDNAIREDHPCEDDVGCEIEVARRNGFTEAAAILLMSATETPNVTRVIGRYSIATGDIHGRPFGRWAAWHRENGTECPACEAYMYAEPPVMCTNCLHLITGNEPEEE